MSLSLFGLGLGWCLAYVAATDRARRPRGRLGARAPDRDDRSALVGQRRALALGGGVVYTGAGGSVPLALGACGLAVFAAAWVAGNRPDRPVLPRAPAPDGCYHSRPADLLVGPFLRMKTYNAKPGEIAARLVSRGRRGEDPGPTRDADRRAAARQGRSRSTRRTSTPATSSSSSTPRRSRSRATSSRRRCTTSTRDIRAACASARFASSSTGSRPRCCARRSRACFPATSSAAPN